LWITELLNSMYSEGERYRMASQVMQLLGKHFDSADPEHPFDVKPAWIPPLVGFLSLHEGLYTTDSPPYPGSIALRILSLSPGSAQFGTTLLPILTLALSSTHPPQSRKWALKVFHKYMSGWFSPQMENVPDEDLENLLRAVGDPFQFTTGPPLYDGQPVDTADYDPMMVVVVLIEFASSYLWRNHLRHSNFTSCEEIVSTEDGWRAALKSMSDAAAHAFTEFLSNSSKVIAAIGRLEELKCSHTIGVVAGWARTAGLHTERGVFGSQVERPFGHTEAVGVEEGGEVIITEGSRRRRRTSPNRSYTSARTPPPGPTTIAYGGREGIPKPPQSTAPTATDFHELRDERITRPTTIMDTPGPDFLAEVREGRRLGRPGVGGYRSRQASCMHPCRGNELTTYSLDF